MALSRGRKARGERVDYWPGFVDALSTLLLAIMFLLSVFVLAQFILSQEITGKDTVLNRLNSQLNELTALLSLERSANQDLEDQIRTLTASLGDSKEEQSRLEALLARGAGAATSAEQRAEELEATLHRHVWLDNQQLPQSALSSKTPLQAMKDWHKLKPNLFKIQPYYRPGCDT